VTATEFSYRGARSGNLVVGFTIVILVEAIALHFLLIVRHPIAAWVQAVLSLAAIVWLVRDYDALGKGAVRVTGDRVRLAIGRRFDVDLSLSNVARVLQPTHRDLPTPGTNQGRDYLNLTAPNTPNVLLILEAPVRVRLTAGMHRSIQRVGLRLDDPAAFIECMYEHKTATAIRKSRAGGSNGETTGI
jgi:hypothetical protein